MLQLVFARSSFSLIASLASLIGAPADRTTVVGRVVDPTSQPVSGAQVIIVCREHVVATATTDAAGRFRAADGRQGCEVRVAMPGFTATAAVIASAAATGGVSDVGTLQLDISAVSESVVVSAAQVDVPLSQAAASVTVITGAEMRARQLTTVADALREVPGLSVVRSGSAGAVTSIFPRGGESDYSLVLIDGVQVNAFGGGFDFSHLSANDIERVEIVRGPQSALFGSNAIGAVVRVVTRDSGLLGADATAEAGGFGSRRMAVSSSGESRGWFWGGGAERLASNGWNGHRTARGEVVANDDYERTEAGGSGGWRSSRGGAALRGELRFERDERGFPGPFGSDPIGAFEGVDRVSRGTDDRWIASVGATARLGNRVRAAAQSTWNRIDGDFISPFGPSASDSRRWAFRTQADAQLRSDLEISWGMEFQRERAGSTFIVDDSFGPIPVKRRVVGYFGETRWTPRDRLFVAAGLRVDDIRRDALAGFADPFGARPAFASDRIISANPRLAASWYLRRDAKGSTKLHAAAGSGIRPPDAFEIAFTDNPSLKPERSRSIEAGVDQALAANRLLVQATVFHNTFDDVIVAVGRFAESSRYRTDNISNARARGMELSSTVHGRAASIDLRASVAYTFLSSSILAVDRTRSAPPPFEPGDPLLRRPRHQWALDLLGTYRRATLWIRGGGRGRVLDVEPTLGTFGGLFTAQGYAAWSAGGTWALGRRLELFARGENLFDRRYEEALGYPALGRSALAGVRVAAGR